ncbi:MAG: hypothetical protein ACR2L1_04910 [Pyrinomonadaceae bacterium]
MDKLKDILAALREHLVLAEKLEQNKRELEKLKNDHDKLDEKLLNLSKKFRFFARKTF